MRGRKRKSIGQIQLKANKAKLLRADETDDQREQKLQDMRKRVRKSRAAESEDQRQRRL